MLSPIRPPTKLTVHLGDSQVFLRPSSDPDAPSDDSLVSGHLILALSKVRRIESLVVRIIYDYRLDYGRPDFRTETGQRIIAEVRLDSASTSASGQLYSPGEHSFAFTLAVPSSTAPSTQSEFGTIRYHVAAIAQGEKRGLGLWKDALSAAVPLKLLGTVAPVGETLGLNWLVRSSRRETGVYHFSVNCSNITVGSILSFSYSLSRIPIVCPLAVDSITGFLYSTYFVKSPQSRGTEKAERRTSVLFKLTSQKRLREGTAVEVRDGERRVAYSFGVTSGRDGEVGTEEVGDPMGSVTTNEKGGSRYTLLSKEPLLIVPAGGSLQLSHLARLPTDRIIQPSTLPGSDTPIEVHHELAVEVVFTAMINGDDTGKFVQTLERRVLLGSCACALPTVLLPSYSETLDTPSASSASSIALSRSTPLSSSSHIQTARSSQSSASTSGVLNPLCVCSTPTTDLVRDFQQIQNFAVYDQDVSARLNEEIRSGRRKRDFWDPPAVVGVRRGWKET